MVISQNLKNWWLLHTIYKSLIPLSMQKKKIQKKKTKKKK